MTDDEFVAVYYLNANGTHVSAIVALRARARCARGREPASSARVLGTSICLNRGGHAELITPAIVTIGRNFQVMRVPPHD